MPLKGMLTMVGLLDTLTLSRAQGKYPSKFGYGFLRLYVLTVTINVVHIGGTRRIESCCKGT
jgi:hypothetical protein